MATETVSTLPWYAPPRVAQAMGQVGRYPLVPLALLTFLLVIPALFASQVAPYDPLKGSLSKRLKPPAWQEGGTIEYPLGTDKLGRDMLSRIIYGARVSLMVSLVAIFVGGVIGTALGMISGYFGGWVDALLMRLVDISLSLPTILLALVLVAAVGPSFGTVITILMIFLWARYARLVRGETLSHQGAGLHRQSTGSRGFPYPHHGPLYLSQRRQLPGGPSHPPGGIRHSARVHTEFSRGRASSSHTGVGSHDRGWARVDRHRVVGVDVPGTGHYADRAVPEPVG